MGSVWSIKKSSLGIENPKEERKEERRSGEYERKEEGEVF